MLAETPTDPLAIALAALAATLADDARARRFLDLTGIGTDELRSEIGSPALLSGLIRFLEAHEPDLISVAEEIGVTPEMLVATRRSLEGNQKA